MIWKCNQLIALQTLINIIYLEYGVWIRLDDIKEIKYQGRYCDSCTEGTYFDVCLYSDKTYTIKLIGELENMIFSLNLDEWEDY